MKRSAADETLFEKTGRAVVFNSLEDLANRIDDPDLDITRDDIMVLQNAGPKSAVGNARGGLSADSEKAECARRQGHDPHF